LQTSAERERAECEYRARVRARVALFVVALAGIARTAHADLPPASRWVGAAVLPERRVDVAVVHEFRLSRFQYWPDEVGDPWADGVDVAVGVTPRLTLGLSHSARSRGTVDHGGGWCHESPKQWCDAAYAGALVDARWRVLGTERHQLGVLARAGVADFGPVRPVVRLGISERRVRGRVWGVVEPEFQIAFGNREDGNRDQLVLPVWIGVGRRRAAAWVMAGVRGELVGFGEKYELPLMLGGAVTYRSVRIGGEAGFPQLAGPQNTANVRHGAVWIGATF
jgi:hypothetical protein